MARPYPSYSEADLERVVRRDFGLDAVSRVESILARYGQTSWQPEALRVRMACLRCADGDVEALEREVDNACRDHRDVLAAAEFPAYLRAEGVAAKRAAMKSDREQLESWLHRR